MHKCTQCCGTITIFLAPVLVSFPVPFSVQFLVLFLVPVPFPFPVPQNCMYIPLYNKKTFF
jgi:hypothetical protein